MWLVCMYRVLGYGVVSCGIMCMLGYELDNGILVAGRDACDELGYEWWVGIRVVGSHVSCYDIMVVGWDTCDQY